MATNRLAGSGPSPMSGGGDGPSPSLTGTLGQAPQASPQPGTMPQPSNMLSGGQGQPQASAMAPGMGGNGQPPVQPPSQEMLMEAAHKQSVVTSHLKVLLGKPDLKTKDILNSVGEVIADGVMSPFDAAKYLSDLPSADSDPLQLRQWVAQHYANATKAMQTVSSMIAAHGQMVRRQAQQTPASMPQQMQPANQLAGALQ
jgi:hypothetical protein